MKLKTLSFILAIHFMNSFVNANPILSSVVASQNTALYGKYEINFNLNSYTNPYDYDEINVYAEFWSPSGKYYKQYGFYYEGFNKTDNGAPSTYETLSNNGTQGWKVRFCANEVGKWAMRITAEDNTGSSYYPTSNSFYKFTCIETTKKGFVEKANDRYLKFSNGEQYYPITTSAPLFQRNVWRGPFEYGTNEVINSIDSMKANGINLFRFEINHFEGLNLIGYDFTNNKNYCKYFNQRDAWQLDKIMEYASLKDIKVLFAVFAHSSLGDAHYCNNMWRDYNPYNSDIPILKEPVYPDSKADAVNAYDFYSKQSIKLLQKKLIRYIIARWGYSTNLFGFELMDEADRLDVMNPTIPPPISFNTDIVNWHQEMSSFIKTCDPFKHLISTAYSDFNHPTVTNVYPFMDFTQAHYYADYAQNNWVGNFEDFLFNVSGDFANDFSKPYMIGEHCHLDYSILANSTLGDPHLYELHNTLWAGMHDGSMGPPSFWEYRNIKNQSAAGIFKGISSYTSALPKLSSEHQPYHGSINGLNYYYLKDKNSDEIYGWIQDANFTFFNLYNNFHSYLETFNSSSRPPLSSSSYSLTFPVSRNGNYYVHWYNTETGVENSVQVVNSSSNSITITMPAILRNGKYSDAGFIVEYQCASKFNTTVLNATAPSNVRVNSPLVINNESKQVSYIGTDYRIHQMWWDGFFWQEATLNSGAPQNVRANSSLTIDHTGKIYFIANDNRLHNYYWNQTYWQEATLNSSAPANVRAGSDLAVDQNDKIYFIATDNRIHQYYWNQTYWQEAILNSSAPQNVRAGSPISIDSQDRVYFIGTDNRVHQYYYNGTIWQETVLNASAPQNVRTDSDLAVDQFDRVYYTGTDNRIHQYSFNGTIWQASVLNSSAPQNVKANSKMTSDLLSKIYFVATDNRIHQYYWNQTYWQEATNNIIDPQNVLYSLCSDGNNTFFVGNDYRIWSSYYGCQDLFKSADDYNQIDSNDTLKFDFIIYPNPTIGEFLVSFQDEFDSAQLEVYNSVGLVILKTQITDTDVKVNLTNYSDGVYFVKINTNKGVLVKKIVKE